MKIGSLLGNVVESLFKKPATQRYPFEREPAPEQLRGQLNYDPSQCTGCQLCVKDCPADAIEIITINKEEKRFVMRYYADRCIFCAQCVKTCRFKCLDMSSEQWELASESRQPFTVTYGREEDIDFLHARESKALRDLPKEE